jgi:hypothetical protein
MDRTRRLLVVTLNASGNWPPELALIRALAQRGHTVRVLQEADLAPQITAAGAEYRPYPTVAPRDRTIRHDTSPAGELDRLIRMTYLNPTYGDDLLTEVRRFAPDVLLVDRMLMAAAVAAESTGLPTALLWHTVYGAYRSRPLWTNPAVRDPLNALRAQRGLARVPDVLAGLARAHAILAFTYEAFDTRPPGRPPAPALRRAPGLPAAAAPPLHMAVAAGGRAAARPGELQHLLPEPGADVAAPRGGGRAAPGPRAADLGAPDRRGRAAPPPQRGRGAVRAARRRLGADAPGGDARGPRHGDGGRHGGRADGLHADGPGPIRHQRVCRAPGAGPRGVDDGPPEDLRRTLVAALADDALQVRARTFAAELDVAAGLARALEVLEALQVPEASRDTGRRVTTQSRGEYGRLNQP